MTNSAEKVGSNPPIQPKLKVYKPRKVVDFPLPSPRPQSAPPQFSPRPPQPSIGKFTGFYRGLVWGMIFGTTALVSAALGASVALMTPIAEKLPISSQLLPFSAAKAPLFTRPINILVLGVDRVPGSPENSADALQGRSDTLLLVQADPIENELKMLSIPRDSRVKIPNVGYTKINDANVYGGPALATEVIRENLGEVTVDRYVRITTDAFVKLVDLVGGVEIFVPQDMQYQDQTQKLNIDLKAGLQTLNGEQAEQFARFRNEDKGDIGRVQRQQMLLKALQKKLYSPANLRHLPDALKILQTHIDTNLTWEEMLALANFGRQLNPEQVKMVMLPGRFSFPSEYDGRSYWIIDHKEQEIEQIMTTYFGVTTEYTSEISRHPSEIRIALQNTTDDPNLTRIVRRYLRQQDFTNVYIIEDTAQTLSESEIIPQQGDIISAQQLQSRLGMGKVEASSTGDLESDLTLRIGLDAKKISFGDDFLKNTNP